MRSLVMSKSTIRCPVRPFSKSAMGGRWQGFDETNPVCLGVVSSSTAWPIVLVHGGCGPAGRSGSQVDNYR